MAEVASAFVSLMPSAKGFGSSAQRQIGPQMNSVAKTTGSRFGSVFARATASPLKAIGATMVGLFAVQKVKQFFSGAIDEARESQKVSALTAQVIKSTGGAAEISAKQVGQMAGRLSQLTGIDDEAIQAGENLLLTFTNIRNEVGGKFTGTFDTATQTVLDMSVALDQDMKSSAIQVGKALNDPIKGVTALSRVGVSFTEQQKKQISTLVESGKVTQAQAVILGELKKEFGGAAAAAATSGDKFHTAFANLQESVGLALLPLLDKLLDKGTVLINFLMTKVPPAFAAFKAAVMPVVTVIQDFIGQHLEAFKTALSALAGSALTSVISLIGGSLVSAITVLVGALASPIALIGALVGAAIYAYVHFEGFRTAVNDLAANLRANLAPVIAAVAAFVTGTLIPAVIQFAGYVRTNVLPALQQFGQFITAQVLPAVAQIATFILTQFYPAMFKIWATVAQKLRPAFEQLVATFQSDVLPTLTDAVAKFREWWPTIQKVIEVVVNLYGKWLVFEATIAGKVLPVVIKLVGFLIKNVVPAILRNIELAATFVGAMVKLGQAVVDRIQDFARFVQGVKEKFTQAVDFVKGIPGKIKAALAGLYDIGKHAAERLVSGLVDTFRAKAGAVGDAVSGIAGKIKGFFPGSPVAEGPLTSWNNGGAGKRLIQMLTDGIIAGTPAVTAAALGAATKVQAAVLDKLTSMRDGVKGILDGLRSDFDSLRDSIASAFMPDVFSAPDRFAFMGRLGDAAGLFDKLRGALRTLRKWHIPGDFLAQLFASGNSALILDLASGTRSEARQSAQLFGSVTDLSRQLGGSVARDAIGPKIDRTNQELREIKKALDRLPKGFGKEINGAATAGHKGRVA